MNPEQNSKINSKIKKLIRVKLTLTNLQLVGTVTMPNNSYHSRLSDLLNNNTQFLALTEVEVYRDKMLIDKTSFMCVNKLSIILLAEIDSPELSKFDNNGL